MVRDLKSYPAYKDSGVPWLGWVPESWEIRRIKHLARLRSGDAITALDIHESGSYPVYGGNGFRGYSSGYTHEGEFVLIGRQGALCGNVNYAKGRFWASEHAVVALPLQPYRSLWFGELLRAMNLNQHSIAAAQPGLAVETIQNLQVPVPPFAQQSAIVRFLDYAERRIRRYIGAKQKLIKLLEEQKQAIIHRAVTCGLDPNVRLKPSGVEWLGDVPEHWRSTHLKRVATIQTGITLGKNYGSMALVERPYLRVANVQVGKLNLAKITTVRVPLSEAEATSLQDGDVLMTEGGDIDKLGRGCIWRAEIEGCLHQNHVFAVRPNGAALLPEFLVALMASHHGRSYFESTAKKTTNLASTNSTTLGNFPLLLPEIDEQQRILAYIERDTSVLNLAQGRGRREIELLREYRTRLIADVVTGKLDVRAAAVALPDEVDESEAIEETQPLDEADVAQAEENGDVELEYTDAADDG